MILDIKIDLNDIYVDDDIDGFDAELKKEIANKVYGIIDQQTKGRLGVQISDLAKAIVTRKCDEEFKILWNKFVETGILPAKSFFGNEKPMRLVDAFGQSIERTCSQNINDVINKYAKMAVDNLKTRYDIQFATMIVKNLETAGLLKENVAQILLAEPKKD